MKEYNSDHKNRIRQIVIDNIRKRDIKSILTLESKDFLFSNLLPDKEIIVWENDADIYKKMDKNVPKNVDLIFGNIGKFGMIGKNVDCIWLDFCRTWEKEQQEIVRLIERLKETKLFVLTFCMRTCAKKGKLKDVYPGDYQFDLINKIQSLTGINWKVIYGESYYDSVQMVTIIMENEIC